MLQHHPDPSQNNCLPLAAFQQWVPTVEQPPLDAYSPPDSMLLEEQGGCCGAGSSPGHGNAITGWEEAGVLPRTPPTKETPTPLCPESRCRCCPSPAAGAMPLPCHPPEVTVPMSSPGEAMLFAPATSPVPPPPEDNTGKGY